MVGRLFTTLIVLLVSCAPLPRQQPENPSLILETDMWEFGTLKRGETTETEIGITNGGGDTLRIAVHSTCDCLTAVVGTEMIPPGAGISILLSYMGDDVKSKVTKTVFIDTNDPVRPRAALTVTGSVLEGELPHLVVSPNPMSFEASSSTDGAVPLELENRGRQVLRIDAIRCYGCSSLWNGLELVYGESVRIDIELMADWPDKRWIEIESNDPVRPLLKVAIVELD
jgi:hypothetical protein